MTRNRSSRSIQISTPSRRVRGAVRAWRFAVFYGFLLGMGVALLMQLPDRLQAMEQQREYDEEIYEFAELFAEVFKRIKTDYVEDVDSKQLFEGAVNGMFETLDPHSSWLPPKEQEAMTKDTEGEYSGVGMHIALRPPRTGGILTCIAPIPGSPAQRAGILPWDRIIEVDGETTKDLSLGEAVDKLTGPVGTKVEVTIWREGLEEPLKIVITRAKIHIDSVFHMVREDGIGYLRLTRFQDDTAAGVENALVEFNKAGVEGVIVDVRFNAGGLLDRAVEICDMFLPKGETIVSIKGREPTSNRVFDSIHEALCEQPVAVLVNAASASASEILAGAVKDNGRGVIVGPEGENTYGKGSVQTISLLHHSLETDENGNPRENGIRLTTAKYYTPSGVSIHEIGIEPDIKIALPMGHERELATRGLLGDPNLDETIKDDGTSVTAPVDAPEPGAAETEGEEEPEDGQSLLEELKAQHAPAAKDGQEPFRDIQLDEAVKYLKAFLIFENRRLAE